MQDFNFILLIFNFTIPCVNVYLYRYVVYVAHFFVGVAETIIGWLNCDVLSVFFSVFSIFCLKFHHW